MRNEVSLMARDVMTVFARSQRAAWGHTPIATARCHRLPGREQTRYIRTLA